MYAQHVPVISGAMRENVEVFKRGALFAILSIRQPILNVEAQLLDVDETRAASAYLFSFKRAGYVHLELAGRSLWERVCALPITDAAGAITILAEVPGLGIVKAGFVAQMLGFDVACLDSRNVAREGRKPRQWRTDGRKVSRRRAEAYVAEVGGRAAEYWDAWCCDVADAYSKTPAQISAIHLAILPDDYIPF